MEKIKTLLFTNWHFMRWLRLVAAIVIAIQAFYMHSGFLGVFSAFFLFQAITNTGCCGSSGCARPVKKAETEDENKQVFYEEIK